MSLRAPESFKDKLDTSDLRLVCREKRHRGGQCSQCACCVSTLPPLLLIINVSQEKLFFSCVGTFQDLLSFLCCSTSRATGGVEAAADLGILFIIIASLEFSDDNNNGSVWKRNKITWESQYLVLLLMLTCSRWCVEWHSCRNVLLSQCRPRQSHDSLGWAASQ